ncbi:MAG TPA: 50S ribosomal protein L11 methyltransferase [Candidatus Deferrimicrobium sp.]|nr:50S ribosomal protein L11 methyltransferase [Candidatus Deferrimicrobium sp.]
MCSRPLSPVRSIEWIEARVQIPRAQLDIVCDYIVDNLSRGLVLEDDETAPTVGVTFYVARGNATDWRSGLTTFLSQLSRQGDPSCPAVTERVVENAEWEEQYRQSVKLIRIGPDIVVRPPWRRQSRPVKYDLIIEPKMSFGTGGHETTRSCLKIISELFCRETRFLDVGCGSGILSILAAKMGAGFVKAIDNDDLAIENCRENFVANSVSARHEIALGSLDACRNDPPYDFICANITKETILSMLDTLAELMTADGFLVLSGLLREDEPETRSALAERAMVVQSKLVDGEWLTFTVRRG